MSLPKCSHGVSADDGRFDGVWAAPFSNCSCCGTHFPYIDSCTMGKDVYYGTHWMPKNLCGNCGGNYENFGNRPKQD